jgi:hypothetical protein
MGVAVGNYLRSSALILCFLLVLPSEAFPRKNPRGHCFEGLAPAGRVRAKIVKNSQGEIVVYITEYPQDRFEEAEIEELRQEILKMHSNLKGVPGDFVVAFETEFFAETNTDPIQIDIEIKMENQVWSALILNPEKVPPGMEDYVRESISKVLAGMKNGFAQVATGIGRGLSLQQRGHILLPRMEL